MADKQALEARVDSFAVPNSKLAYDMMAAVVAVFPPGERRRGYHGDGGASQGQQRLAGQRPARWRQPVLRILDVVTVVAVASKVEATSAEKSGHGDGGRSGQQGGGNQC
jgi:hypothetical protein